MKKLLVATLAMTALSAWADDAALIAETKNALGACCKRLGWRATWPRKARSR